MKQILELVVYDGSKVIAQQKFEQNKVVLGRILSADFRIPDSRVSRIHALVERMDDGKIRLTDLASSHGTNVNGEKIIERIIGPQDEISISGLRLEVRQLVEALPSQKLSDASDSRPVSMETSRRSTVQQSAPEAVEAPAPIPAPEVYVATGSSTQVAVKTSAETTVISSLKETARSRGVLEAVGGFHEELEVTVYWEETVLHVDHYHGQQNRVITVGESAGNNYIVASRVLPEHFEFIRVSGSEAEILLHPSMRGSARVRGQMIRLDGKQGNLPASVRISGDDIAKIEIGSVHFFLMFVGRPPAIIRDKLFDQGRLFWMLQLSFSFLMLLLITLGSYFETPIEGQVIEIPEKYRRVIVQTYQAQQKQEKAIPGTEQREGIKVPNASASDKNARAGGDEGEGARERGAEGRRGDPKSNKSTGIANSKKADRTTDPYRSTQIPGDAILSTLRASKLGTRIGMAGGSGGRERVEQAFTGVGGGTGSSQGSGGSGLQGTGPGGGGTAVGVGGLGTKGFGQGAKGSGMGALPGKGDFAVATESVSVFVLGSLSREEIERVVNSHRNEVQYCYAKELQRDPGLNGKITFKWSIVSGGQVEGTSLKENTTGSRSLADCIETQLKAWTFPSPAQGSKADVEWPWVFKPRGT